jgi:hypothetical protein
MQTLHIQATTNSPEIIFKPKENIFIIRGTSSPEDVRSLYYPVTEWIKLFIDDVIEGEYKIYNTSNPVRFQVDLTYFNSSSAKFLYDILLELKRLIPAGYPVLVEWFYDEMDSDMKDAGTDISQLAGVDFSFIPKK